MAEEEVTAHSMSARRLACLGAGPEMHEAWAREFTCKLSARSQTSPHAHHAYAETETLVDAKVDWL
jgi:hypothetical protein